MSMNESLFSGTTIRTRRSFSWFRTLARPSTTTTTSSSGGAINGNPKKRDRDDNDSIDGYYCTPCISSTAVNCHHGEDDDHDGQNAASCCGPRPAKRLRHDGEALMSFDKPYPCAYHDAITVYSKYNGSGWCCLFRSTCSYHHGMPEPCDCNEESCPRGHAHRRAPRVCQHASACRWMTVGECSFHHGHAVVCHCHDLTCLRAHPDRIVKQVEIRQEIQVQKRQEHNARKLHFAFRGTCKANIADVVHHVMRQAIQIATMTNSSNSNNDASHGSIIMDMDNMMDPVETVTFNSQQRFGVVAFQTPALATASLLQLNGLLIPNTGRIRLQRPTDYRCSIPTTSNSTSNDSIPLLTFDTSRLDIKQIKMSDQSNKNKAKKRDVIEPTQTNKENVTDDPPPTTSARLFRDWLFQTDADVIV